MKTNHKEHIAEIALQLFAANGYGNTSIASIAKKARVAQGLLYNFFPSKEALLYDMLEKGFDDIRISMEGFLKEKDPKKALKLHIESTFKLVEENKHYWCLFHSIKLQEKVRTHLDKKYAYATNFILKTLADNFKKMKFPTPLVEAKIYFATIDGLVVHYLINEKEFPLKEIKKHLIKKYGL